MYFSATIFALLGFLSPTLAALSVAITNFIFTLVAFAAIDRIGRRRMLMLSIPAMVVGLVVAAGAFSQADIKTSDGQSSFNGELSRGDGNHDKLWPGLILASIVVYVGGYATGLGCVPWQQSEYDPSVLSGF